MYHHIEEAALKRAAYHNDLRSMVDTFGTPFLTPVERALWDADRDFAGNLFNTARRFGLPTDVVGDLLSRVTVKLLYLEGDL